MAMHPRLSLHQVGMIEQSNAAFVEACRRIGIANAVLVADKLIGDELAKVRADLAEGGPRIAGVTHVFCRDLARVSEAELAATRAAIDVAGALGAPCLYMLTGGRGALSWEQAAERFAELVAPCRDAARERGVNLLIENASALYADIHIAHTLADTIALAQRAGIGVCVDLFHCWAEGRLDERLQGAVAMIGLVQVSDYVLGDRALPARAVPGDGAIPLERIVGSLLAAGYAGTFDLELVGPRIAAQDRQVAFRRAAERVSDMLARLGA